MDDTTPDFPPPTYSSDNDDLVAVLVPRAVAHIFHPADRHTVARDTTRSSTSEVGTQCPSGTDKALEGVNPQPGPPYDTEQHPPSQQETAKDDGNDEDQQSKFSRQKQEIWDQLKADMALIGSYSAIELRRDYLFWPWSDGNCPPCWGDAPLPGRKLIALAAREYEQRDVWTPYRTRCGHFKCTSLLVDYVGIYSSLFCPLRMLLLNRAWDSGRVRWLALCHSQWEERLAAQNGAEKDVSTCHSASMARSDPGCVPKWLLQALKVVCESLEGGNKQRGEELQQKIWSLLRWFDDKVKAVRKRAKARRERHEREDREKQYCIEFTKMIIGEINVQYKLL